MIILVYMKNSRYPEFSNYRVECKKVYIDNSIIPILVINEDKDYAGFQKTTKIPLENIIKYEILEDMPKEKINET